MKAFKVLMLVCFLAFSLGVNALASVGVKDDGTMVGGAVDLDFREGLDVTDSGGTKQVEIEQSVQFNVGDFIVNDGTNTPQQLSGTTTPGLEVDNTASSIVWADGEETPVQVTFVVPKHYRSGGAFRICADESDSTTPNTIDFSVYVTTPEAQTGWDSSATNQTAVALTVDAGTPEMVTLSVTTDFASLAIGDIVILNIWREDAATGATGDLEVYYAEFYCNE